MDVLDEGIGRHDQLTSRPGAEDGRVVADPLPPDAADRAGPSTNRPDQPELPEFANIQRPAHNPSVGQEEE